MTIKSRKFLCLRLTGTVATVLVSMCPLTMARADTQAGTIVPIVDTTADYQGLGSFTSIDRNAAPNGVNGWFHIVNTANWKIDIRYETGTGATPSYKIIGLQTKGFNKVNLAIKGFGNPGGVIGHQRAPHAEAPNPLPAAASGLKFVGFNPRKGAAKEFVLSTVVKHAAHHDHYSVKTRTLAQKGPKKVPAPAPPLVEVGPPNLLTGTVQLGAAHREKAAFSFPSYLTMLFGPESGSTVSFDAATGELAFSIGGITSVDRSGGQGETADPAFAEDPILDADLAVSSIRLEGKIKDGYAFSGGSLRISDPFHRFELDARFDEYNLTSTDGMRPLRGFSILTYININNGDLEERSAFIDQFVDVNLFRNELSEKEAANWLGVDFAFVTQKDLVDATAGFTKSVADVPATFIVTTNSKSRDSRVLQ